MPNFNYVQVQPNGTGLKMDTSELVSGTNTVERQNMVMADPNTAANVQAVVAKGVQGAFGAAVQDLKDSGRVSVVLSQPPGSYWSTTTSEVMQSFAVSKAGAAQLTAQGSYTVTAGKTLRIQIITLTSYYTTPNNTWFNIRAGATTAGNLLLPLYVYGNSGGPSYNVVIPDGFEIAGGTVIGLSVWQTTASGSQIGVSVIGYEY